RLYDDPKSSFLPLNNMDKDLVVDFPGFRILQSQSRLNNLSIGLVPLRWLAPQREFGLEERSHGLEMFRRGKDPSKPGKIVFGLIDMDATQQRLSSVELKCHRGSPLQRFRTTRSPARPLLRRTTPRTWWGRVRCSVGFGLSDAVLDDQAGPPATN